MAGGHVEGTPRLLLRAEGAALAVAAVVAYAHAGAGWWLFALLILAPDLSLLGYLAGPRAGAAVYNAAHTTVVPLALLVAALLLAWPLAVAVGLIWLAHVGVDRLFGYGLKYADRFGSTHLGPVGRR